MAVRMAMTTGSTMATAAISVMNMEKIKDMSMLPKSRTLELLLE